MEPTQSIDPFAMWRDFYNRTEQAWTDLVQQTISTPSYAEKMGKTSQAMLNNLEVWRTFAERYITEVWNLPTRNDLGRLGEVVVAIDAKADDLDDRADNLEAALGRIAETLGTVDTRLNALQQNGPVAVQERSAQLDGRVANLEKRLDDLTERADRMLGLLESLADSRSSAPNGSRARNSRPSSRS